MTTDAATIDHAAPFPEPGNNAAQVTNQHSPGLGKIWKALDQFLFKAGDWLNPILVKETRQALKSSQFTITFVLVLLACWIATVFVIAAVGPRIFYAAEGGSLLVWYYGILALPLIVVVPLSAFRSLTAEREDNTYDLLSITALKPRQIISGKLGSSVAQMAVYFSAITPCLAFTYMLRGVDLPTIASLLLYTFFWSLGLSMIGILLATLTTQRFVQVFILVALVAGLLIMFMYAWALGSEASRRGRQAIWGVGEEYWTVTLAMASFYATFFALAYFAAAGLITFTSENRSTPLRICMVVQQAVFVGWIAYGLIHENFEEEILLVAICFAGAYWFIMGSMLTAERPGMSQRVRRSLPQSFLGRVFFSWLNPGPATGYMFVIANITTLAIIALLGTIVGSYYITRTPRTWISMEAVQYLIVIGWGYIAAYLGIGLLLIMALRRVAVVTMLACVLIQFLLVLAGFGIPFAIKSMSLTLRDVDYTFLQITDPFSTMHYIKEGGLITDGNVIALIVIGIALCVLLLNIPRVIRELNVVREAAPARVLRDEAELHPPPEALPQSPWDE